MTRPYNKKSPYWDNLGKKVELPKNPTIQLENLSLTEGAAADATYSSSRSSSGNFIKISSVGKQFPIVDELPVPFEDKQGKICVSKAIELCQKVYFNVAYFRNTIEAMVEFTCTPIHVKCKNKSVREFIQKWLKKIDYHSILEQITREYFRSGNVFIMKFLGQIQQKDLEKLESIYGAGLSDKIPISYVVLNPINIGVDTALFTTYSFVKIFSQFEIYRLQNPQTDIEKQIAESLPETVKTQLKSSKAINYVYMPLDPERICFLFYKKQPYEPLAVPLGYSVLDDIEHKLALKKMDRILAKTVENIILLITTGTDPEKGGINVENIKAIQNLFKTPAAARVLVSDYTTDAKFIVPDLEQVLGPEKYTEVDKDIKEGLQNALLGESKFADTMIKTKLFIERLQEVQQIILDRFLMPEVIKVCDAMNFKNYPTLQFEKIKLDDENIANKVITRLLELGILTPSDGIKAMETGIYPDNETLIENQKEYKKQRDDGYFYPLVGGSKPTDEEGAAPSGANSGAGRPTGSKAPKSTNKVGIRKAALEDYKMIVQASNKLFKLSEELFAQKIGKELTPEFKELAKEATKQVVTKVPFDLWEDRLKECYLNSSAILTTELSQDIDEFAKTLELDNYSAALLYHASTLNKNSVTN